MNHVSLRCGVGSWSYSFCLCFSMGFGVLWGRSMLGVENVIRMKVLLPLPGFGGVR